MILRMGRDPRSAVGLDRRVLTGLACGGLGPTVVGLALGHWTLKSTVSGLMAAVVCVVAYVAWLYGRDRYERWIVSRHTYRPEDR